MLKEKREQISSRNFMGVSKGLRHFIYNRDNFICQICGFDWKDCRPRLINIDHVIPKSRRGTSNSQNLQTSCIDCNILKANRLPDNISQFGFKQLKLPLIWLTKLRKKIKQYDKYS